MALTNCKQCGRLFNRTMKDICPECVKQDDEDFMKVGQYLRANRGASPQEVHEETEVALEKIFRFIREGRLIAEKYPAMTFPCERCGLPIQSGRFCRSCSDELKQQFDRVMHQDSEQSGSASSRSREEFYLKKRFERK
ncbi:TIGR03826 family flagellar region protein [Effusibacillus dendaii]|uniref:Flagellar protein n=1 Tax=Effusibacillus dendaii TaxID=2743772 RepID=A0A7I8DJ45_9BACL|nr:TIGR03826 family flagellar region protein [Effusibacillus dendaii]BCJ87861.1 hypothetical protein skT53_28460 [Effusibacillus dendaii]